MKRKRVPPNMAAQVPPTFGSDCWLDMPGCTHRGTETMDHVKPYSLYGPTVPSNLRRREDLQFVARGSCGVRLRRAGHGRDRPAMRGQDRVCARPHGAGRYRGGPVEAGGRVRGRRQRGARAGRYVVGVRTGVCPAWSRPGMCGWCAADVPQQSEQVAEWIASNYDVVVLTPTTSCCAGAWPSAGVAVKTWSC